MQDLFILYLMHLHTQMLNDSRMPTKHCSFSEVRKDLSAYAHFL